MKISKLVNITILYILSVNFKVQAMQMQHGFILFNNDTLGSHLVANGHHSRQVEILGQLIIQNSREFEFYQERKKQSRVNQSYFLFQAQQLDLPKLKSGAILAGHLVESKFGKYEPQNIVVKSAVFHVQRVLLNIPNPFFLGQTPRAQFSDDHCCETSICHWMCPEKL
jgi:hypothetical protein